MINVPQNYKYNFDKEISYAEYAVIGKFLEFYRHQSVLVADRYFENYDIIPLKDRNALFKTEETSKTVTFSKLINFKRKPYVVELSLWRNQCDDRNCLNIEDLRIITDGEVHYITLDTYDTTNKYILFDIIDIFDERKIISSVDAYSKLMYTNESLQYFINNHEWQNIDKGIEQKPELANALFLMQEEYANDNCNVYFGTILYQLLKFRMNSFLAHSDLEELDNLILKLRKAQLLKVHLHERNGGRCSAQSTKSILLEPHYFNSRLHIIEQSTVDNSLLLNEKTYLKALSRVLK